MSSQSAKPATAKEIPIQIPEKKRCANCQNIENRRLTTQKLLSYEIAPFDDDLLVNTVNQINLKLESNTNWKRVRDENKETLEEWIQNKKANIDKGQQEVSPLDAALQQTGIFPRDIHIPEPVIESIEIEETGSNTYNFRSRSATRPPSSAPSTPISTGK
jgi:hypothetical protein